MEGTSIIVKPAEELLIVGCMISDGDGPGFGLPLLKEAVGPSHLAVQEIDEWLHLVCGFRYLEGDVTQVLIVQSGKRVRVGDAVNYAFVDDFGTVHCGTLGEIEATLRSFFIRHPEDEVIALQIAELIGTPEERRACRVRVKNAISERTGRASADAFYRGSAMRLSLWDRLLDAARSSEAAARILASRPLLGIAILENGKVQLDLSALDPRDYAPLDAAGLAAALEEEFDIFSILADAPNNLRDRGASQENWKRELANNALASIKRTARQEERIAIVLDTIFQDVEAGLQLLSLYERDRAKYANWVLAQLRHEISLGSNTGINRIALIKVVRRPFLKGMPTGRAALLYYFAKHLAKYDDVKRYLRGRWRNTYSYAFNPYRERIDQFLD